MDMLEGVGRRSGADRVLELGIHSLNGYERNELFRNDGVDRVLTVRRGMGL